MGEGDPSTWHLGQVIGRFTAGGRLNARAVRAIARAGSFGANARSVAPRTARLGVRRIRRGEAGSWRPHAGVNAGPRPELGSPRRGGRGVAGRVGPACSVGQAWPACGPLGRGGWRLRRRAREAATASRRGGPQRRGRRRDVGGAGRTTVRVRPVARGLADAPSLRSSRANGVAIGAENTVTYGGAVDGRGRAARVAWRSPPVVAPSAASTAA